MWDHFEIKKPQTDLLQETNTYRTRSSPFGPPTSTFNTCKNRQFHLWVIIIFLKNNLFPPKFSSDKSNYWYCMHNLDILQNKHWRQQSPDLCTSKSVTCRISSGQLLSQQCHASQRDPIDRQRSTISVSHLPVSTYVHSCARTRILYQLSEQGHKNRKHCSENVTHWTRSSTNDQQVLFL